jgi:hypothetical protein
MPRPKRASDTCPPFAVKDCALVAIATGRRAQNLKELRDELVAADPASIYFHFWGGLLRPIFDDPRYNNGFARWVDHELHNQALAERLSVIDPVDYPDTRRLRARLVDVIEEELDRADALPWTTRERRFHFVRSQIVVFDTRRAVERPPDLTEAVASMTPTSIFYHFVDARRRTPDSVDDFSTWLTDWDREGFDNLCRTLAGVDPFFRSLVETREELVQILADSLGK